MLTLYYKTSCPYCQRVLGEAETMGVQFNLKDITSADAIAEELIEKGGKRQVPYLVDEDRGVSMYESGDIVDYLKEHYSDSGAKTVNGVRVHKSEGTCDVCE